MNSLVIIHGTVESQDGTERRGIIAKTFPGMDEYGNFGLIMRAMDQATFYQPGLDGGFLLAISEVRVTPSENETDDWHWL